MKDRSEERTDNLNRWKFLINQANHSYVCRSIHTADRLQIDLVIFVRLFSSGLKSNQTVKNDLAQRRGMPHWKPSATGQVGMLCLSTGKTLSNYSVQIVPRDILPPKFGTLLIALSLKVRILERARDTRLTLFPKVHMLEHQTSTLQSSLVVQTHSSSECDRLA